MVTSTLKNYTDENIAELIERIKSKSISYNLNDLKSVLAEVNTRHMDAQYADLLGELIRDKILNGDTDAPMQLDAPEEKKEETKPAEEKKEEPETENTEPENKKEKKEKKEKPPKKEKERLKSVQQLAREEAELEDEAGENERFPVLSFTTGFLKVAGWICLAANVIYGLFCSISRYLSNIKMAIGSIFSGLLVGTILLLVLYAWSESISVKLETEKHLRKLAEKEDK